MLHTTAVLNILQIDVRKQGAPENNFDTLLFNGNGKITSSNEALKETLAESLAPNQTLIIEHLYDIDLTDCWASPTCASTICLFESLLNHQATPRHYSG